MSMHFFTDEEASQEPEATPIQYKLELHDGNPDPLETVTTFGGWNVEGDFLMVYDVNGIKSGWLIPDGVISIVTIELPDDRFKVTEAADDVTPTKEGSADETSPE